MIWDGSGFYLRAVTSTATEASCQNCRYHFALPMRDEKRKEQSMEPSNIRSPELKNRKEQ
jgi:hypothetical protein